MTLWKSSIFLSLLLVALSAAELEVSSPANITNGDLLDLLPNHREQLKMLLEKLSQVDKDEKIAILNDYGDDLLKSLNDLIISYGLDPIPMPNIEEEFEWKILLITYRGLISLKSGWLQGLGTIQRTGDVILRYQYPYLRLTMPLGFRTLLFDYQYKTKFIGIKTSGNVDGTVTGCKWLVELKLNMVTLKASLEKYRLATLGDINVRFGGNPWTDWMLNMFVSVTVTVVQPVLRLVLNGFIGKGLDAMIGFYNQFICNVLGGC